MANTKVIKRTAGVRTKHAVKRQILLEEASRQMNERGAGALNLSEIAERAGLSRNALYYYVTDRADIAFQCYLRTCEATTENLAIAYEEGDDAVARIRIYVERMLSFDQPVLAALYDPDFLPEPQRSAVFELSRRNIETLQSLIEDGVQKGDFKPVNSEIAAQMLLGMINWTQLSVNWLGQKDGKTQRKRVTEAVIDLFFHGLASTQGKSFDCQIDVSSLTARPFNAFDRVQATQEKMAQLVDAASRIFNRRGIDGASLDEISASVGATKGAVYHYFDDKMDLITRCYGRAFELYSMFVDVARENGNSGFERSMLVLHLNSQAQGGSAPPLVPQPGIFSVPESKRLSLVNQSREIWSRCAAMIREGMEDGSCRACDARTVAHVSAGAFLWLHKWLPENYKMSPMQIADAQCGIFTNGLVR